MICVFIDSDVWHFLYERRHQLDIDKELPLGQFCFSITREAEFELESMPHGVRDFAKATIARRNIPTDSYFGFAEASVDGAHRVEGFNRGRFASLEEMAFLAQPRKPPPAKLRPSRLYKNEADISIAARSFQSVALSLNKRRGPLKKAKNEGGEVVFLNGLEDSGMSLRDFIHHELSKEPRE
jgi:hypothetical protein